MCNKCCIDGCCNNVTHEVKVRYFEETKYKVCKKHAQEFSKLMFSDVLLKPEEVKIKRLN
jgi:hypothetical protein